ncbi:unnamed protein product, partial [marine sediment metagenome]
FIQSCGLHQCLDKIDAHIKERGKLPPNHGIGVSAYGFMSGGIFNWFDTPYAFSAAIVRINIDGKVDLFTGACEIGQGSDTTLRIVLGLPFVLFFPGYVLMAVLFPKREGLGGIERVALSFGMSIAVVPLIGLILNYTWWGITLEPTLYSIASFIFVVSIIAWVRRRRLPEEERFNIEFQLRLPGWGGGAWDKVLSVVLVVAILGALGTLGYVIAKPKVGERFTEFYILGVGGKAEDYPQELTIGEEGKVIVGIINREHERVSYHVEVMIDNVKNNEVGPIELE